MGNFTIKLSTVGFFVFSYETGYLHDVEGENVHENETQKICYY